MTRAYRISAYAVLGGLVSILALYINGHISIWGMVFVVFSSYFIINFFVQLHSDASDALMILYLDN